MKTLYFCLIALGLLSGCQSGSDVVASTSQITPLNTLYGDNIAGKIAIPLNRADQQYWLMTSETQGILMTDAQGEVLSHYAGNMEILDWRENVQIADKVYGVLSTYDNDLGEVLILGLDWQTQQLSLLSTLAKDDAQIEALCLYTLPEGHLSLFMADALGQIEQRIIVDASTDRLVDLPVHRFIGAPQTKACAVDDQSHSLYLVEENIGVWRYSADPESELARQLITAVAPFGPLEGEVTAVDVLANGDLLVSAPEQQGVWHINQADELAATFIPLPGVQKAESVQGAHLSNTLLLGIYDDQSGQYLTTQQPFTLVSRTLAESPFIRLSAFAQTDPVEAYGDAADDPAIWINAREPEQSRVLGTNKKQGLMVYDLQGKLLQALNVGRVNNVDLRYDVKFTNQAIDLAAASNRSNNSISLFSIQQGSGELALISHVETDLGDVYGLCMYQDGRDYYVFINDTDGRFQQYHLNTDNKPMNATLVREFQVPSQPEGCVADDASKQLFFGEESTGIWQISADPQSNPKTAPAKLIATVSDTFVADVEGMGIYRMDGKRYLVASSQGNNSFGVFALDQDNQYLGSFQLGMDITVGIDGVSETDGLELTETGLGTDLPDGLLVVQDGRNRLASAPQNFKLVDGSLIKQLIKDWLEQK